MATKPRLIYDNLWRKGIAIASTPVADAQHPVSDTQIDTKSMFWKSSDKDVETQLIPMDLGDGTRSINFVAILGHNIITGDGQNITVEEDDDSGFGSINAETDAFTWAEDNIFEFLATPLTERYIRVKLVKTGGFATAPQVATILCGSHFEPNRNFAVPYSQGIEDYSKVELSDSINLFSQEKPRLKTWTLPFRGLDNTSKGEVLELMDECGIHKAFVIVFDSDNPNTDSHLVRLEELVAPENIHVGYWNWEMAIKEVI